MLNSVILLWSIFILPLLSLSSAVPITPIKLQIRTIKISCGGTNYVNAAGSCLPCKDSRALSCASPSGASTACQYKNYVNGGVCSLCPAATFSAGGSGQCSTCGIGVSSCDPGNSIVLSCLPGWKYIGSGNIKPSCVRSCPTGVYCDPLSGTPLHCLAGYAGIGINCKPCPNTNNPLSYNTYALEGSTKCSPCDIFSTCLVATGGILSCISSYVIYISPANLAKQLYVLQCVAVCPKGFAEDPTGKACIASAGAPGGSPLNKQHN